jgi:pimeloyl-ACP methyl ester carboxylesterase
VTEAGGPAYERYRTAAGEEWLMRIGATEAAPILFLPPLFEEMNRTRALLAATMRLLAGRGFGCWLPDLPGTGESERSLDDVRWGDWTDAAAAAADRIAADAGRRPALASLRGGGLLDGPIASPARWRFAPVDGASLARDLERASLVAPGDEDEGAILLAGYPVSAELLAALKANRPETVATVRTVRLSSDRAEADQKVEGPALWRRSEPGHSPELAAALAADLADWLERCAAC